MAARGVNLLPPNILATATKPGKFHDGAGLYLYVEKGGSRRWVFRCTHQGKECWIGLGSASQASTKPVSLARAREKADALRRWIGDGNDPHAFDKPPPTAPTFKQAAETYITEHESGWRNAKHCYQWRQTIGSYACPVFGDKPVDKITTEDVLKALRPIWTTKAETAQRTRGRIERILDAERAIRHIPGLWENPARWTGHLEHLLTAVSVPQRHQASLAYADLPAFMVELRSREAMAATLLEFVILTAARSGEARLATWREFDRKACVWTVPAERMKMGVEHQVPLSDAAVAVLDRVWPSQWGDPPPDAYVFPGRGGKPLSMMGMLMLLRRMKRDDISVHGFRSSFRTWAGNETEVARELVETSLAHALGSKVERAYWRGNALERRRELMQTWADFCNGAAQPTSGNGSDADPQITETPQIAASNVVQFPGLRRA